MNPAPGVNVISNFVNRRKPSFSEYLRVYGDTVIVAGSERAGWGGKMTNAGKTEHLRFTGVWMKQRGRWQEVARQANIVPQQ